MQHGTCAEPVGPYMCSSGCHVVLVGDSNDKNDGLEMAIV